MFIGRPSTLPFQVEAGQNKIRMTQQTHRQVWFLRHCEHHPLLSFKLELELEMA